MMAGKARLLSDIIGNALVSDEAQQENSTLKEQMLAFKEILIHDITPKGFADVYAQTIAYGMFAARLHDPTIETFRRQEAAELIPKSNPFLRKLFGYIAGPDIDDRIKWVVDSLTDIFLACNVEEILKNYGKATKMEDPIIHFYETFLSEYDPKLRKARGVWYTPAPVVNFIVRAVDDILKTEFDLPQGLADTSKTAVNFKTVTKETADRRSKVKEVNVEVQLHKVQILDPATGTGTFLAEVVKHIHKKFKGQEGIWSNYVETHLLPRLNGFELLMASYAMAHLKLDLLLKETGFKPTKDQRFKVYLTNSLEEHHQDTGTLFANWLSSEANEANHIKRDTPVMCVIGNPPYAVSSTNKNPWIENLISDYKKDLNEKSYNSLSDDYVKFIRYGQHFIEKNGSGILAYISNNSFIDGIVFRQMRKHLLETFDKVYILDLHGNAKKKETSPDGSADQNVFDIMQGVSINIFIKTGKKGKNELGKLFHYDLYGKRKFKYDFLSKTTVENLNWIEVNYREPNYFYQKRDYSLLNKYKEGFIATEIFKDYSSGVQTEFDEFSIQNNKNLSNNLLSDLKILDLESILQAYGIDKKKSLKVFKAIEDVKKNNPKIRPILYRPFDIKSCIYTGFSNGVMGRPRGGIMNHFNKENYGLAVTKVNRGISLGYFFILNSISDRHLLDSAGDSIGVFPLYLYPESNGQQSIEETAERTPNLNMLIVNEIVEMLGLTFTNEKFPSDGGVAESRGGKDTSTQPYRNTQNYMSLPYNPALKERARGLRKAGNLSEVLFWNEVKNKQFKGFDFDRQKIIGNYIVDFFCTNCNVVIEIDGSSHDDKVEYDAKRDEFLQSLGLTVIHIEVDDVMKNMNGVIEMLLNHPALKGTPPSEGNFAPIDLLDYIYAVLHSPTYREKYKEFLKIDFPRVSYPKNKATFWKLVKLGGEIRQIHLLESPKVEDYITQYPIDGDNIVIKPLYKEGKVYINETQYFDNVPEITWNFYIGGYQPAQKWLKDRKNRSLEFDDILHYQKIIVALSETDRLMKEIDKIEVE